MDIILNAVHENGKHGISFTSPRSGKEIIAWLSHAEHLFTVTKEDSRFFVGVNNGKQGLYRVSFLPAEEQLRVREILPCIYNYISPSLRYRNILYLSSEDGISWFNLYTLQCSCPVRSIAEIEDRFLLVRTSYCNQLVSSSTGEAVYSFSDDWGIRYECESDTGTVYRMVKFPDGTCDDCLEKLLYIDRSDHVVRETAPVQSLVLTIESWAFGSSLTRSFADTYKKD